MKKYGLIGYPLSHSFSKKYFSDKFSKEGITDCQYDPYPIKEVSELPDLLKQHPELHGLNVTIPHKEAVVNLLDYKDPVVASTGACNCIRIVNGKLFGHNTYVTGFQQSLLHSFGPHPGKALIFGTGGAAKAVEFALSMLQIPFQLVSRKQSAFSLSYDQLTPEVMAAHTLLINTTPLGMFPHITEAPPIPYDCITEKHCLFDLIYNPEQTLFLQKGAAKGAKVQNGYDMLVIQAEESWKIWNL